MTTGVDAARLTQLRRDEYATFERLRPRSMQLRQQGQVSMPNGVPMSWMSAFYDTPAVFAVSGAGSRFVDVDGLEYSDFNLADMSMFCGYGPSPVTAAVCAAMRSGAQFMMATEIAIAVAEQLSRRWSLPKWQFTLSASQANTEAIRVARVATGRPKVVMFEGKYHGHFDDSLVALDDGVVVPEEPGVPPDAAGRTVLVPFNDLEALKGVLETEQIALVLTEPAMTNVVGLVTPVPGFLDGVRELTRSAGTLLAFDETHTHVVGVGGLVAQWNLQPDILTVGKAIAGGVPFAAYGMTEAVAACFSDGDRVGTGHPSVATGGTLFANPVSVAAALATMTDVLTPAAYDNAAEMGTRLADGIDACLRERGLPWVTHRLGPRSGFCTTAEQPRNAADACEAADPTLTHALWVYLANRGVWDALIGAGPTCGIQTTAADVDGYLEGFAGFLDRVCE